MVPGDFLLHYRLAKPIGEGGMGQVWRATDTTLGRDVAIKFLPPAFAEDPERLLRFEREAKVLAALNHPHIAANYGFHEARGVRFLVMELVPGETLAERIERGRIPTDEVRRIAVAVASALEYAHEHGIVHRDLKPSNVKVADDGTVKVLDFGLAKAIAGDPSGSGPTSTPTYVPTVTSGNTATGIILGTAAYMSPEQARGRPVDKRADVWAFGVVLFEMIAGRRLFEGETSTDTLAHVLTTPIPFDEMPGAMRSLVRRCLDRDVRTRLRDIGEARIALESGAREEAAETPPRRAWPYAVAGAIAGALLTLTVHATIENRGGSSATPSVRVTLALPDPVSPIDEDRAVALSPDGTELALCAQDSGTTSLYLRAIGSLDFLPVTTGGGCTYPFWSPDGKSIGFFSEGKLKRVDLADRIARVLCDAPEGRGGSWSVKGVIAFAPGAHGPIFRVADTGGAPSELTKLFEPDESQRVPQYLPDGRRLLFTSYVRSEPANEGVYLFDPDAGAPRLILATKSTATYVDPGFLAYVDEGNLMLRPLDPKRIEFTGEARPIAADVAADYNRRFMNLAIAPGGALVFQTAPPEKSGKLAWLDREGHESPTPGATGRVIYASLSPDEKIAALTSLTNHGEYDLVHLDLDRGIGTGFGDPKVSRFGGAWTTDGRLFSFVMQQARGWQLLAASTAGQATPVSSSVAGDEYQPGPFTPDGRAILFQRGEGAGKHLSVMIANVDGKTPARPLISRPESCGEPQLSPDGRALAFLCTLNGREELMASSFPEIGAIRRVSDAGAWRGQWGWISAHDLWWIDTNAKGWTAEITSLAPKPLFDGKTTPGFVPCYSRTRDRFLVVLRDARASTGRFIFVSDWRAALGTR